MAVTSQRSTIGSVGQIEVRDWQAAGLLKPSVIKPVLTTIESTLILKKLGRLTPSDQALLRQGLAQILG
ncbi:MAG: toxin-antitoxin system, toxin component, MazF family protein [Nitrospiraceae bacterium]